VVIYSLYQIHNNTLQEDYKDKNNSFWCLNLVKQKLNYYSNYGVVHNNRINYLNKFDDTLCNNLIYKHINTAVQIFDFIRINNSGREITKLPKLNFDVCIVDETNDDFLIKRNENSVFYFLVLEKFFLRAHGLLEKNNTPLIKQIYKLNDIESIIHDDMQFGYNLNGLNAGLFDYSPSMLQKKLNIVKI